MTNSKKSGCLGMLFGWLVPSRKGSETPFRAGTRSPNDSIELRVLWSESLLIITAHYGQHPAQKVGEIKGAVDKNGIGFLGDIHLETEIRIPSGILGLSRTTIPIRGVGNGRRLLERFEQEMTSRGVLEIQGNLVPEKPEKQEWLIDWYRSRDYTFHPGETAGAWVPPGTMGIVSKRIGGLPS